MYTKSEFTSFLIIHSNVFVKKAKKNLVYTVTVCLHVETVAWNLVDKISTWKQKIKKTKNRSIVW